MKLLLPFLANPVLQVAQIQVPIGKIFWAQQNSRFSLFTIHLKLNAHINRNVKLKKEDEINI